MTDRSTVAPRTPPTIRSLSTQQSALVKLMQDYQFGRIENMPVRAGQPVLDGNVRVVRSARLGAKSGGTKIPSTDDFELKKAIPDLLDELMRLQDGTVVRLEFRRGLPALIETTPDCASPVRDLH